MKNKNHDITVSRNFNQNLLYNFTKIFKMKKTLFTLLITMVFSNFIFGQITLEKTYSSENLQVYTNATETYYYTIGDGITDVKFYKSDYTIYKQFTPIIPSGYTYSTSIDEFASNFVISKNIFNTDSKLEIIISFSKYNSTTYQLENIIRIYNEDGVIIKEFGPNYKFDYMSDGNIYHDNTTNTNKLRLFNQATNSTEIYNLGTTSLTTKEITDKNKLTAFPIPTNKNLNIVNPNNGNNSLQVYDENGKIVINKLFTNSEKTISLDVEFLPNGLYLYKIGNFSSKFLKN